MELDLVRYIKNMFAMETTPEWSSAYEGVIFYDKSAKKWVTGVNTGWQIIDRPTVSEVVPINWVDPFEYPTDTIIRNNYISTTVAELGVLYLKSNHTDGSTAITDYSPYGHIVTIYGGVHHEDYLRKFGISSLYFQPPGSYLSIANHSIFTFGTDDFTIDLWYCPIELNRTQRLVCRHNGSNGLNLTVNSNNTIKFEEQSISTVTLTSTSIVVAYTWVHIAVTRVGSLWSLFINGIKEASAINSNALYDAVIPFQIGRLAGETTYDLYGVLDDIRIVRGRALWTSNFTPNTTFISDITIGSAAKSIIDVQTTTSGTYGAYAMKLVAPIDTSENHYIIKKFLPVIEITNFSYLKFDTTASRVGNNISISLANTLEVKSIILDIAANYGSASYTGIRSVDFYSKGIKIDTSGFNFFIALATSSNGNGYTPNLTFDTSLPKLGGYTYNQWFSAGGQSTNQRLICIFNTPIEINAIIINNSHNSGTETNSGVKTVKIYTSSDSITSTVYNEIIPNSTLIFDGVFNQHVTSNIEDPQNLILSNILTTIVTKNITHYDLDTWQTEYVDLSTVSGTTTANIVMFKILNDDLENTIYVDNMYLV